MKIKIKLNDTQNIFISAMLFTAIIFGNLAFLGCETITTESIDIINGERFIFPLQSDKRYITKYFGIFKSPFTGAEHFHDGLDIRANVGTTVIASLDGIVSVVNENPYSGKYIIINHTNGYLTIYNHLNSFNVKQGDLVTRGSKIAESGNTGFSTGPHLHFGIYQNDKPIDPIELFY